MDSVRNGGPGTDRELALRLGLNHRQDTAPRITKLIELGALAEIGERRDAQTGKSVRVVGLPSPTDAVTSVIQAGCDQPDLFAGILTPDYSTSEKKR